MQYHLVLLHLSMHTQYDVEGWMLGWITQWEAELER